MTPPRALLRFARLTLALALAAAFELLHRPRCRVCGRRWDPGLVRGDGRCAVCTRVGREQQGGEQ